MKTTFSTLIGSSVLAAGVALTGFVIPAEAATFGFTGVTNNNATNTNTGVSQLSVDVTDAGNNQVLFTFKNIGSNASSIADVYFDDGSLLSIASLIDADENGGNAGVDFSQGANPPNLPGGQNIDFNTTAGFLADSDNPVQPNGVNPGETLGVLFNLKSGKDFQDVLDAINLSLANPGVDVTDGLRIGIHVQGFANGGSESFVNGGCTANCGGGGGGGGNPQTVPEPSTSAAVGLFALGMLGLMKKQRNS